MRLATAAAAAAAAALAAATPELPTGEELAWGNANLCRFWGEDGPWYSLTDVAATTHRAVGTLDDGTAARLNFRVCGALPEADRCPDISSEARMLALFDTSDGSCVAPQTPLGPLPDDDLNFFNYAGVYSPSNADPGDTSSQPGMSGTFSADGALSLLYGPRYNVTEANQSAVTTVNVTLACSDVDEEPVLSGGVFPSTLQVRWATPAVCGGQKGATHYDASSFVAPAFSLLALALVASLVCTRRRPRNQNEIDLTQKEPQVGRQDAAGPRPGYLRLWFRQLGALLRKNLLIIARARIMLFVLVCSPAIAIAIASIIATNLNIGRGYDILPTMGLIILAYSLMWITVFNVILDEKRKNITALLRMMGVSELAHWLSWALAFAVPALGSALLAAGVSCFTKLDLMRGINPMVLTLFLFTYAFAMCCMGCFLASFCRRPMVVNIWTGILVWVSLQSTIEVAAFTSYRSYSQTLFDTTGWSDSVSLVDPYPYAFDGFAYSAVILQVLFLFLPFMNFLRIFNVMAQNAVPGKAGGFDWGTLGSKVVQGCEGCVGKFEHREAPINSLVMMLGSAIVYICLAWYVAQIAGGELRQPVWFMFQRQYWTGIKKVGAVEDGDTISRVQEESRGDRSIRLHKLSKAYKGVTALKEVSLKIDPDSIFVILGHNGAGKTTLVQTLSGMQNPTNGHAFVRGRCIREEMRNIQQTMGFCPQHDALWDNLSAEEHIRCYASLKGAPASELAGIADRALRNCDLQNDAHHFSSEFSGGMKRRLSVAISSTGDPDVIFLDEPTTGMDPLHRRQVWGSIQRLKQGRILVLTTHLMEEADRLADSIGILSAGKLRAWGTALFLKNRFGAGYQISLQAAEGKADELESLVKEQMAGAEVVSSSAGNVTVSVSTSRRALIPRFFRHVEATRGLLKSWGLSNTTLEEVFLRLCASDVEVNAGGQDSRSEKIVSEAIRLRSQVEAMDPSDAGNEGLILVHPVAGQGALAAAAAWPQPKLWGTTRALAGALGGLLFPADDAAAADAEMPEALLGDEDGMLRFDMPSADSPKGGRAAAANTPFTPDPTTPGAGAVQALQTTFQTQVHALLLKALWVQMKSKKALRCMFLFCIIAVLLTVLVKDSGTGALMFVVATQMFIPQQMYMVAFEKQTRLYFMLKLQGMKSLAYWVAHYLVIHIGVFSFTLVLVVFAYACGVGSYKNASPLFFLLLSFMSGHINACMSVFLTSVFRNPKVVMFLGLMMPIAGGVVAAITVGTESQLKHELFLIPPVALGRCLAMVFIYGDDLTRGGGDGWGHDASPSDVHGEFAATIWVPGLFCTFGILPLGALLHAGLPNEFGVSELTWADGLIAQVRRCCGCGGGLRPEVPEEQEVVNAQMDASRCAVSIRNMTHYYTNGKRAVSNLSLDIAQGECFGLLGPNGAGKTTAMGVLSGLLRPTLGRAAVSGHDCATDMAAVHRALGVCPQFDTVWGDLTVEEHLKVYAVLKGCPRRRLRGLVQGLGEQVELDGDAWTRKASDLSGGMRRRLSLAVALVGGPPVLLLDEPSTGLDPEARRRMWAIIDGQRKLGRSVVLTTHSMDEADTLSQRIGIMNRGRLCALGTPLELKRQYGTGFRLGLIMSSPEADVPHKLLTSLSSDAELVYRFGKARTYLLAAQGLLLSSVFEQLDKAKEAHGIREWGLSQATLEEVFVKVAGEQFADAEGEAGEPAEVRTSRLSHTRLSRDPAGSRLSRDAVP